MAQWLLFGKDGFLACLTVQQRAGLVAALQKYAEDWPQRDEAGVVGGTPSPGSVKAVIDAIPEWRRRWPPVRQIRCVEPEPHAKPIDPLQSRPSSRQEADALTPETVHLSCDQS